MVIIKPTIKDKAYPVIQTLSTENKTASNLYPNCINFDEKSEILKRYYRYKWRL